VSDGKQNSAPATVTVTINPVNHPPLPGNNGFVTNEDQLLAGTLVMSDVDGDALTYSIVSNGTQGTATITNVNTGAFTYTPGSNANGSDSFTFIANDGTVDSVVATAAVTITAVNDAPLAVDGSSTTNQDTPISGSLSASDVDGDALTYSLDSANPGSLGTVVINNATGAYTYTPTTGMSGADAFGFYVNDGSLNSVIAIVSITINAASQPNQPPVANTDNISAIEGSAVTANVIANDQDADQDVLYLVSVDTTSRNGGAIVDNGDGTITYTPPAGFWGSDTFSYQITDGQVTVTGNVAVTISSVNSTEIRVNAGGSEVIDSLGRTWAADYGFNNTGIAAGIANAIGGKESVNDAYLYQTERTTDWDLSTISYSYDVPNGEYHVVLHFADTYFWLDGQRVFNVSIEGQPLINNLDIISEVSYNAPLIERFDVLVSDGTINIDFIPVSEIPVINAIEIIAKGISRSAIPGTVQAEDYNAGENGAAYYDIGGGNDGAIYRRDDVDIGVTYDINGGYKVGWTQDYEWLNYDVFVAETGFYDLDIRVSNFSADWYWGRMKLELDGADLTSLLIAPLTTGWDMFEESSVQKVPMTAGPHTLKLIINQGGIDVNWLKFTKHISFDIPGRVEAEDYGRDGAGGSYYDSSMGNYAGWYRNDDVDVDITSDVGGGYKVAWIDDNEWLKYDVAITTSGIYDIEFRVSKGDVGDAIFHLEHDGADITGPITVNGSGTYDWNMFDTLTVNNVNLTKGTASFRIVIDQASLDINWMQFILISPN